MVPLGQPPHVEEVAYQEPGEAPHLGLPLFALLDDLRPGLPHGLELHGISFGPPRRIGARDLEVEDDPRMFPQP